MIRDFRNLRKAGIPKTKRHERHEPHERILVDKPDNFCLWMSAKIDKIGIVRAVREVRV